jgi:hypothetical protein
MKAWTNFGDPQVNMNNVTIVYNTGISSIVNIIILVIPVSRPAASYYPTILIKYTNAAYVQHVQLYYTLVKMAFVGRGI